MVGLRTSRKSRVESFEVGPSKGSKGFNPQGGIDRVS